MIDHALLHKALAVAVGKGADYADIYVEKAVYNFISADDKKIKTAYVRERGVGVRVVKDRHAYYAITNAFDESSLLKVAAYVRDAAGGKNGQTKVFDLRPRNNYWAYPFASPPADAAIDKKVEIVKTAEETAWMAPYAIQATVGFQDSQREILLASTLHNTIIEQTLGLTEFSVSIIVEKNGVRESARHGKAFFAGIEALTGEYAPDKFAATAADMTSIMLEAKDCPRGEMPVVFAPGSNGILFHESCGHGMEADLVEKGSSFTGKRDQQVASPLVTLVDDGTLPGYPGSFEFDDEGIPSENTVLIENGILRNYMQSSITAASMGMKPTGSARRESFEYPPIPRMRNTYILAGESDPEDIIKETKRGLYALKPGGGGQVNVFTGEFITSIKLGYMIEDGKLAYPVKGASIVGRGIDALQAIDMVGRDLVVDKMSGRCGKGQQVPVGCGMPTVRVKSLTVGGTGEAYGG